MTSWRDPYVRAIRQLTGGGQPDARALQLRGDVSGVVVLDDLAHQTVPKPVLYWAVEEASPAVAARSSVWEIRAGTRAVWVERLNFIGAANAAWQVGRATLITANEVARNANTWGADYTISATFHIGDAAGAPGGPDRYFYDSGVSDQLVQVLLRPGEFLSFANNTPNSLLQLAIMGFEYPGPND